jgi:hypothetical protein
MIYLGDHGLITSAMLFPYVFYSMHLKKKCDHIFVFIVVIQGKNKNIRVYFCTKDTPTENESDWPAGNYCILKHGEVCPDGKYCELVKAVILFIKVLI